MPLPSGADAVAPFEIVERDGELLRVFEDTAPGRNVGAIGEDIQAGEIVLARGRILRPQNLAVLSALGLPKANVVRKPVVVIIVTGDELLPSGSKPVGSKIADANSTMLAALYARRRDRRSRRSFGR